MNRSLSGVSNQSNIDLVSGRDITITLVNRDNAGTHACVATSQLFQETITITRTFRLYVGGRFGLTCSFNGRYSDMTRQQVFHMSVYSFKTALCC